MHPQTANSDAVSFAKWKKQQPTFAENLSIACLNWGSNERILTHLKNTFNASSPLNIFECAVGQRTTSFYLFIGEIGNRGKAKAATNYMENNERIFSISLLKIKEHDNDSLIKYEFVLWFVIIG